MANDPERRRAVERTVETLRQVWSGGTMGKDGFLRPTPVPPILIAAFGPKVTELAGRIGDGICVHAGAGPSELATIAREAHARAERDPHQSCLPPRWDRCPSRLGSVQSWMSIDLSCTWRPRSPTGSNDWPAQSQATGRRS